MDPTIWAERAHAAADSVNSGFGHRLLGAVPGTWIASVARPAQRVRTPWAPWHYWWQAHYLDCLVDAAQRRLAAATGPASAPRELALARDLLAGIRVRNGFRYRNWFYDDMAWLALASDRLGRLQGLPGASGAGLPAARAAVRELGRELVSAETDDLGGGLFWNTRRRYKNTASTGPGALFFARTGDPARAQRLVDWLNERLLDPEQGLYLDGLNLAPGGAGELVRDVWTYNQGPILGALLALGGADNLARAAALTHAVAERLTVETAHDGGHRRALRADGGGDGGLFMGILARHLADAAGDPRLPLAARSTARGLVTATAEALWAGAELRTEPGRGRRDAAWWTFPQRPGEAASDAYPPGRRVELSTQLQAWMVSEAAHRLTQGD
ncbi:putative alpha-1,6-mannanase (GH76 family) [Sinomonas atrocyanea]|uniref:glycoside hydrolase family 76 protein n=1 Tax=Sinomonas atrocyanea TaxID=37927 RepID=UPI002780FA00|nr:glycoside hydrolase family 76 protein [Sinomonas atrocyanea]MDQ0260884.1 putative alpha-1,6-mannanase (GH76 family) [Sinomonas atrocyanea]